VHPTLYNGQGSDLIWMALICIRIVHVILPAVELSSVAWYQNRQWIGMRTRVSIVLSIRTVFSMVWYCCRQAGGDCIIITAVQSPIVLYNYISSPCISILLHPYSEFQSSPVDEYIAIPVQYITFCLLPISQQ